jgi:hypothetical protein
MYLSFILSSISLILSQRHLFQSHALVLGTSGQCTIQVCENKNCIKQFSSPAGIDGLTQVFSHLIHPNATHIVLQKSACLSQCGKGPNVCIVTKQKSNIYVGVKDVYIACALLKDECDWETPPILLAALDVMDQANGGTMFFHFIHSTVSHILVFQIRIACD